MRTTISIMLAATALAMLAPAAGATTARTVTLDYAGPNGIRTDAYRTGFTIILVRPQITIPLEDDETTVSIHVDDVTGGDVFVGASYAMEEAITFCTATDEPFVVPAGEDLRLTLAVGTCEDGSPSIPTIGTITAEIS